VARLIERLLLGFFAAGDVENRHCGAKRTKLVSYLVATYLRI
jgi:hypothetical protein